MAKNVLQNINLNTNEMQNMVLQPLATDPAVATSKKGQLYYNTATNSIRHFNGTAWSDVSGGVVSVTTKSGETAIYINNTDPNNPVLEFKISATQGEGVSLSEESDGLQLNIQDASTDEKGITKLDSTPSDTIENTAATPKGANVKLEELATPTSGYVKSYELKQGGVSLGKIDIPKDFLVKKAEVKTCTEKDKPIAGLEVGDLYIDLTINVKSGAAETDEHIYIDCKKLGKFPYKKTEDIAVGSTSATISLPAKSKFVSAYAVDANGNEVLLDIKITEATDAAAGSVVFTIASAYTEAISCYATYIA